jgi:FMN reductase
MKKRIKIAGVGGSLDEKSSTYFALKFVVDEIHKRGADTILFDIRNIKLPMFEPEKGKNKIKPEVKTFLKDMHTSNGYVFSSPEYHGTVSGIFKNVIDYFELLKEFDPPYITGKPVGCIATGGGEISGVTTLQAMVNIIHNLRGISASGNVAIGNAEKAFDTSGKVTNIKVKRRLERLAGEVYELASKL